jgi:hypothetical protein
MSNLVGDKIYVYDVKNISIPNVLLESCLKDFYDIVSGSSAIRVIRSIFAGMFSFGLSMLVPFLTVEFTDKLGFSGVVIGDLYLKCAIGFIFFGLVGFLSTTGIKISGYYKNKIKMVDQFTKNIIAKCNIEKRLSVSSEDGGAPL